MRALVGILAIGLIAIGMFFWRNEIFAIHRDLPSDTLSAISSWASIYGFIISCIGLAASAYAAFGVRQIKHRMAAKARLPILGKHLQRDASKLSDMAEVVPIPQKERAVLFSSINANLIAVRRHLPRNLNASQKRAMSTFHTLASATDKNQNAGLSISQISGFWETYEGIQLLKNEIDHHLADERWEA
jgi:hypothetical protein